LLLIYTFISCFESLNWITEKHTNNNNSELIDRFTRHKHHNNIHKNTFNRIESFFISSLFISKCSYTSINKYWINIIYNNKLLNVYFFFLKEKYISNTLYHIIIFIIINYFEFIEKLPWLLMFLNHFLLFVVVDDLAFFSTIINFNVYYIII